MPYNAKLGRSQREYEVAFIRHQFKKELEKNIGSVQKGNHPEPLNFNK